MPQKVDLRPKHALILGRGWDPILDDEGNPQLDADCCARVRKAADLFVRGEINRVWITTAYAAYAADYRTVFMADLMREMLFQLYVPDECIEIRYEAMNTVGEIEVIARELASDPTALRFRVIACAPQVRRAVAIGFKRGWQIEGVPCGYREPLKGQLTELALTLDVLFFGGAEQARYCNPPPKSVY